LELHAHYNERALSPPWHFDAVRYKVSSPPQLWGQDSAYSVPAKKKHITSTSRSQYLQKKHGLKLFGTG